jgi:sirohydrochlorin cobaltochelatase
MQAIVLFAHGSREPGWARPFERIAESLAKRLPGVPVKVAYLERMTPTPDEALAALAAEGIDAIRVVPLFLGTGGHVKEDLPKLVERHPGVRITLDAAIGEQEPVIEAIAAAIAAGNPSPR